MGWGIYRWLGRWYFQVIWRSDADMNWFVKGVELVFLLRCGRCQSKKEIYIWKDMGRGKTKKTEGTKAKEQGTIQYKTRQEITKHSWLTVTLRHNHQRTTEDKKGHCSDFDLRFGRTLVFLASFVSFPTLASGSYAPLAGIHV